MLNVAVFVSGSGTNLQAIIDGIESKRITNASIRLVISNKEDVYALKRAAIHQIPTRCIAKRSYKTREEFGEAIITCLKEYNIDLAVLAGYLVILPPIVLKEYQNRIINVHPSLIPAFCGDGYYGLKVHEEVLKRGCKITGATVHFVDEGTDTGPIILQRAVNVEKDDTKETLQKRVMEEAEWDILPEAIHEIANGRIQIG